MRSILRVEGKLGGKELIRFSRTDHEIAAAILGILAALMTVIALLSLTDSDGPNFLPGILTIITIGLPYNLLLHGISHHEDIAGWLATQVETRKERKKLEAEEAARSPQAIKQKANAHLLEIPRELLSARTDVHERLLLLARGTLDRLFVMRKRDEEGIASLKESLSRYADECAQEKSTRKDLKVLKRHLKDVNEVIDLLIKSLDLRESELRLAASVPGQEDKLDLFFQATDAVIAAVDALEPHIPPMNAPEDASTEETATEKDPDVIARELANAEVESLDMQQAMSRLRAASTARQNQ